MRKAEIGILVGVLVLGFCVAASAQTVVKVGFVDFQKIIDSWPDAKQKIDALEAQYALVQSELDSMDKDIQQRKQEIESRAGMFSNKEEEQRQWEEYRTMVQRYLETFGSKRADLEKQKQELLENVRLQVKSVVQHVAESKGYSIVLRKQDLVYSVAQYDITDDVIAELRKRR